MATQTLGIEGRSAPRRFLAPGRVGLLPLLLVPAAAAGLLGYQWWAHGRFVESTNDAYLAADQVTIAPRVQGYVEAVLVKDNESVAPGQPLLRIDSRSYVASLDQKQAALDARRNDVLAAQGEVAQLQAGIARADAELMGARSTAAYMAGEQARYEKLSQEGVETDQRAAQARYQADQARMTVRADEAARRQADEQLVIQRAHIAQALAQVASAQAELSAMRLSLNDTIIRSGVAGAVGDKTVRVGQYVQPGTRLMTVVPLEAIYLVANFKETQIGQIRLGQKARVKIDALEGRTINATVESFAPGTGARFALLPPENATGNFTKIVQRVPVRLVLRAPEDLRRRLLPGMSATVRIDTAQEQELPELRERMVLFLPIRGAGAHLALARS